MGRLTKCVIELSLVLCLVSVFSNSAYSQSANSDQQLNYPPASLPVNGGKLGVRVDSQVVYSEGIPLLKVLEILPRSTLISSVEPGDFIFGVDGYFLRDSDDLFKVVSAESPGNNLDIHYLDEGLGFKPRTTVATLYGAEENAGQSSGSTTVQSEDNGDFYCTQDKEKAGICTMAALGLLYLLFGGGGGSSESEGDSQSCPEGYYRTVMGGCKCENPDFNHC